MENVTNIRSNKYNDMFKCRPRSGNRTLPTRKYKTDNIIIGITKNKSVKSQLNVSSKERLLLSATSKTAFKSPVDQKLCDKKQQRIRNSN